MDVGEVGEASGGNIGPHPEMPHQPSGGTVQRDADNHMRVFPLRTNQKILTCSSTQGCMAMCQRTNQDASVGDQECRP